MQPADNMQLGDADLQRLAGFPDNFFDGKLEAVRIAFLAREGTELAGKNAVIRVIDVAIDDVTGPVANLALAHKIRNGPDGVQIPGFKQPQGAGLRNAFASDDLVVDVAQFAALNEKIHAIDLTENGHLANRQRVPA